MKISKQSRARVSKIMKEYFKDQVFDFAYGNMRCKYKIKSVIPNKEDYEVVCKPFKIHVEVLSAQRQMIKRGEDGSRLKDADGLFVMEYKSFYADKRHAHRYNHSIRNNVKDLTLFKVFGIHFSDLEVGTVKWN